jgi:hypothetical protein
MAHFVSNRRSGCRAAEIQPNFSKCLARVWGTVENTSCYHLGWRGHCPSELPTAKASLFDARGIPDAGESVFFTTFRGPQGREARALRSRRSKSNKLCATAAMARFGSAILVPALIRSMPEPSLHKAIVLLKRSSRRQLPCRSSRPASATLILPTPLLRCSWIVARRIAGSMLPWDPTSNVCRS